jgi:DNA-binding HxlR family transcriptional regulator
MTARSSVYEHILNTSRVVHERMRLVILSELSVVPYCTFPELQELLGASSGNLSVHAARLERAGLIVIEKSIDGLMPRTEYRITQKGIDALKEYVTRMQSLFLIAEESEG